MGSNAHAKVKVAMFYVFALIALLFLITLVLSWAYSLLPLEELRRRARANERDAKIYKVASRQGPLNVLLWFWGVVLGITLITMATRWAWWGGALTGFIIAWLVTRPPQISSDGWAWYFTGLLSPAMFKKLDILMPLLKKPAKIFARQNSEPTHIFEKADLVEFLDGLKRSTQTRISPGDLFLAASALKFSDTKVSAVMTPKKKVRFVSEAETVGPKLMDELFATGFKLFPVVRGSAKAAQPEVTGTLELKILLKKLESGGKIESIANRNTYFINEDASLPVALDAIVKHHHPLLLVVNKLEEIVGVISLEQILAQVVGRLPADEFDEHASLKAVAGRYEHKESAHDEPLANHVVKS